MPYTAGQRVKIINSDKYFGLGTVERQLPKNVVVVMDSGLKVRFAPYFLTADLGALTETPRPAYTPIPVIGTLVLAVDTDRIPGLHVVIGEGVKRGSPIVKIAKLGGADNRYWMLAPNRVTVVPLDEITSHLR